MSNKHQEDVIGDLWDFDDFDLDTLDTAESNGDNSSIVDQSYDSQLSDIIGASSDANSDTYTSFEEVEVTSDNVKIKKQLQSKIMDKMRNEGKELTSPDISLSTTGVDEQTLQDEIRKNEKLERNKQAARKSRQKKKECESKLKKDNEDLNLKNQDLKNEVQQLTLRNGICEQFISSHTCSTRSIIVQHDHGDSVCQATGGRSMQKPDVEEPQNDQFRKILKDLYEMSVSLKIDPQKPQAVQEILFSLQTGQYPLQWNQSALQENLSLLQGGQFTLQEGHSSPQGGQYPFQWNQSALQGNLSSLQGGQFTLQEGHSSLQGGQYPLQENQSSLQGDQYPLQENQFSLQGDQYPLQENLSSLQGGQSTLQEGHSSLQGGQYSLDENQSSLQGGQYPQGNQSSLQGDQYPLQGNQSSLQGDQYSLQGNQSSLQGDQYSLQGNQSSLQGDQSSLHLIPYPLQEKQSQLAISGFSCDQRLSGGNFITVQQNAGHNNLSKGRAVIVPISSSEVHTTNNDRYNFNVSPGSKGVQQNSNPVLLPFVVNRPSASTNYTNAWSTVIDNHDDEMEALKEVSITMKPPPEKKPRLE